MAILKAFHFPEVSIFTRNLARGSLRIAILTGVTGAVNALRDVPGVGYQAV